MRKDKKYVNDVAFCISLSVARFPDDIFQVIVNDFTIRENLLESLVFPVCWCIPYTLLIARELSEWIEDICSVMNSGELEERGINIFSSFYHLNSSTFSRKRNCYRLNWNSAGNECNLVFFTNYSIFVPILSVITVIIISFVAVVVIMSSLFENNWLPRLTY